MKRRHAMNKTVSQSLVFLVLLLSYVVGSLAQDTNLDRNKAKIVLRVYQLTYGADEMCKRYSPEKSSQVSAEVMKFKKMYPELMNLVENSPYFDQVKKQMSQLIDSMSNTPQYADCPALLYMLHQFTESESGKEGIKDIVAQLKK